MGEVVRFERPPVEAHPLDEEAVQHGQGTALCIACRHEWQAVVPTGTTEFECPACGTMKGKWKFEFRPEAPVWTCNCGNDIFYMTELGHMCANCGIYQRYD